MPILFAFVTLVGVYGTPLLTAVLVPQNHPFSKTPRSISGELPVPFRLHTGHLGMEEYSRIEVRHPIFSVLQDLVLILLVFTVPAKLDPVLMREPRVNQGAPIMKGNPKRKPINTGGVPEVRINGQ